MNWKLITLGVLLVLAASVGHATEVSTYTILNFNVATVVEFTNTLLGESPVTAASTPPATTQIEFNSSTGSDSCVEAKVVGGSTQSNGNPIMSLDNTGTVNINLSANLSASMPACMTLLGKTTYDCSTATTLGTGATSIVTDLTPGASAQDWYMWTTFNGCSAADSTTRTLTILGSSI